MKAGRRFRSGIEWHSCAAAGVRGTRPFAKNAKERGTLYAGGASEIKSPGHPPYCVTRNFTMLDRVPLAVVTVTKPVAAPTGTVAFK
jgi:hypothetical protein